MRVLLYLMPIIAGGTRVLFMLKPLVAIAPQQASPHRLEPKDEPLLFHFVARLWVPKTHWWSDHGHVDTLGPRQPQGR